MKTHYYRNESGPFSPMRAQNFKSMNIHAGRTSTSNTPDYRGKKQALNEM